MTAPRGPRVPVRPALTRAALALALAVGLGGLLPLPPAGAEPLQEPDTGVPTVLTPGVPVDLGMDVVAGSVRVDENSSGSHVAVVWSTRPTSGSTRGRDQVWARLKQGGRWGRSVRLSTPAHPASRATLDLDTDGSLLVGWAEKRSGRSWVVLRRLTGEKAGRRVVLDARPTDGPYVAAGALHEAVAWTARSGGVVRPYAVVDTGAGYGRATRLTSSGRRDVVTGTLTVDASGPQVLTAWLSRSGSDAWAQSSWAVRDTFRSSSWVRRDDAGPRQRTGRAVHRPALATDARGRTVLLLTNETGSTRYPTARMWTPTQPGVPGWMGDPQDLSDPDHPDAPAYDGLHTHAGVVLAARPGSPGLLTQVLTPNSTSPAQTNTEAVNSSCAGYDDWFALWLDGSPELHCLVPGAKAGTTELWHANTGPVATLAPDPRVGGRLDVQVPSPALPVLLATERAADGRQRTWLVDHTEGGRAEKPALRSFSRARRPKVTGTARVGKLLRVHAGSWHPTPARVTRRWYADGRRVKGATGPTLHLTKKMRGKRIAVKVTVHHAGVRATTTKVKVKQRVRRAR